MPRSKFGDIYRDLKYKIESGEYPYQSLVPSENTLVAVYRCSRNTVRRALDIPALYRAMDAFASGKESES